MAGTRCDSCVVCARIGVSIRSCWSLWFWVSLWAGYAGANVALVNRGRTRSGW